MGQALARAKKGGAADGAGGKLEFNPVNESIILNIISFVESYPAKHAEEARLRFRQPLAWRTQLKPEDFSGARYEQRGDDVVAVETTTKDGPPVCRLHFDSNMYELSVHTMQELSNVLNVAGDRRLNETHACLEALGDPIARMVGDRFGSSEGGDASTYRYMEEILQSPRKSEQDDEELEDKKLTLRLAMHLQKLDTDLLKLFIEQISTSVRLSAASVEADVTLIREFCGNDREKHVLHDLKFTSDHIFLNGCRSPPWRQVYGDIAYVEVKPHDGPTFWLTASTLGYYESKGLVDPKGGQSYDRVGEMHDDIISAIKAKSPKFSDLIYKQHLPPAPEGGAADAEKKADDGDRSEREEAAGSGDKHHHHSQQHRRDDDKKGKKADAKKKLEPSLKWKTLGVDELSEDREQDGVKVKEAKAVESSKSAAAAAAEKTDGERPSKRAPPKARSDSRNKSRTPRDEESFSESSSESDEEEEPVERHQEAIGDLPSDYWQIQKLVKYLKGGNQTATIIALCAMRDFSLSQESSQLAIRDVGGLEVLINLLDTDEIKCKIGALKILKEISKNAQIRRAIADLGGLQTMVKILRDANKELKSLAAETIANVAKFRRARRTVRQHGGIKKLVGLLDCAPIGGVGGGGGGGHGGGGSAGPGVSSAAAAAASSAGELEKDIDVARCGALALWSCSKSTKNKLAMRQAGAIPLLARLLKSPHESMLIPVVGTLQECASEPSYRLAIRTEGMIQDLVTNLRSSNQELQMHCASAIFKCAEEKETRDLVRQFGGLDPLVALLNNTDNKALLAAATGAIWKCAVSPENVLRFQELRAINLLVNLLNDQPEEVLVNVVGALGECAKDPPNRSEIRKAGGISPLVHLLTGTNQALLINVTRAVGQCAEETENMAIIDRLDGVRLLWSLLKNQNPEVQASAAWAICPCIENAKDAGEMVRSFVGGLELIVSLLKSEDREVLASVCAAIANIAKDEENLAVITDHGVVPMLARLTDTRDDRLRRHLAEAIARCCSWGNNRISFGREAAVAPLVSYLKSKDKAVHRSTAKALFQLSKDPDNCITMHEAGVVKPLMEMVGSEDEVLQEAAAGCISNIRRLALANEKAKYS